VSLSSGDEGPLHFYTKVASTAQRISDHQCKKTFSTASVMNSPKRCVQVESAAHSRPVVTGAKRHSHFVPIGDNAAQQSRSNRSPGGQGRVSKGGTSMTSAWARNMCSPVFETNNHLWRSSERRRGPLSTSVAAAVPPAHWACRASHHARMQAPPATSGALPPWRKTDRKDCRSHSPECIRCLRCGRRRR
jgi:hypothetical protein